MQNTQIAHIIIHTYLLNTENIIDGKPYSTKF